MKGLFIPSLINLLLPLAVTSFMLGSLPVVNVFPWPGRAGCVASVQKRDPPATVHGHAVWTGVNFIWYLRKISGLALLGHLGRALFFIVEHRPFH